MGRWLHRCGCKGADVAEHPSSAHPRRPYFFSQDSPVAYTHGRVAQAARGFARSRSQAITRMVSVIS